MSQQPSTSALIMDKFRGMEFISLLRSVFKHDLLPPTSCSTALGLPGPCGMTLHLRYASRILTSVLQHSNRPVAGSA